ERTGRQMDLWQGNCYVHVEFTARSINRIREEFPDAPVVAHPECTYAVRMLADEVCSTEKMVAFCKNSPAKEIIVVTEAGMLHRLKKEIPGKTFIPGPTENCFCGECRYMKMNTLEKAYDALLNMEPEITLSEQVRARAEVPILRMLERSKVVTSDVGHATRRNQKRTGHLPLVTDHFFILVTGHRSLITSSWSGRRSWSSFLFCCSGFCFCASRGFNALKKSFCAG